MTVFDQPRSAAAATTTIYCNDILLRRAQICVQQMNGDIAVRQPKCASAAAILLQSVFADRLIPQTYSTAVSTSDREKNRNWACFEANLRNKNAFRPLSEISPARSQSWLEFLQVVKGHGNSAVQQQCGRCQQRTLFVRKNRILRPVPANLSQFTITVLPAGRNVTTTRLNGFLPPWTI